ncbi:hypothetical protein C8246_07030 [Paracidovorax avenae]|nr:hypothetical protein C8246_07030 [Paracidovorax avenae]
MIAVSFKDEIHFFHHVNDPVLLVFDQEQPYSARRVIRQAGVIKKEIYYHAQVVPLYSRWEVVIYPCFALIALVGERLDGHQKLSA